MGQKGDLGFEKCESSFEDLVEAVNLRYIYGACISTLYTAAGVTGNLKLP